MVLTGLISLFIFLVLTRPDVQSIFLRAPGTLFQQASEGRISNLYTVKIVNKTHRDLPIDFRLEGREGRVVVMGAKQFLVPKDMLAETSVIVELDPATLTGSTTKISIGVFAEGKRMETVKTAFVGPRH